jgi:hypothetical protein
MSSVENLIPLSLCSNAPEKHMDNLLKGYTLTLAKTKLSTFMPNIDKGIAEAIKSTVYPNAL